MANFYQFWFRLCQKNNALLKDETKMTITVASFKAQMEKAYTAGTADRAAVEEKLKPRDPKADFLRGLGL